MNDVEGHIPRFTHRPLEHNIDAFQLQAHAWPDPPQPITKSHDYGMWLENAFKAGQIALEQYNAGKQREQELKMAEMQMGAGPR